MRDREYRKFFTGFRDVANFFTGIRDPTSSLVGPLGQCKSEKFDICLVCKLQTELRKKNIFGCPNSRYDDVTKFYRIINIYVKNRSKKSQINILMISLLTFVLLIPLAETIKEVVSFILKGVDLIDHTSIFLLRTTNHYVTLIMCTLS